ncbi:MAG: membrane protein insertase YidC, partial [Alphaproteobacteria bacterium]
MTPETKNMIAAMSLSLAILIGWQVYFVEPELEADRAAYEARQQAQNDASNVPQPNSGGTGAAASQSLTSASDTGTRLDITAPLVTGSVSTMGARIDDLILTSYSQTLEDGSEPIRLFSRFDSEKPYFAE